MLQLDDSHAAECSTQTAVLQVVDSLNRAPYCAAVDLAYQSSIYGQTLLGCARAPDATVEERTACLSQASVMFKKTMMSVMVARGPEHPQYKQVKMQMAAVRQLRVFVKKAGLVQSILDKKKAREQSDAPSDVHD